MSCQKVQKVVSAYLDQTLAGDEQDRVAQHLAGCRECAARSEQVRHLRVALQSLPPVGVPPEVEGRLRVLVSHERARRLSRVDLPTRLKYWVDCFNLWTDNLMRPLALPFAGGLVSALLLFGMLVPTLLFQFNFRDDVPTAFYTEPSLIEAGPLAHIDEETVVELTINERGQVTNYSIPSGKLDGHMEKNLLADLVLFSRYSPASLFGRPTTGKVTVSFRRSRIVVKG